MSNLVGVEQSEVVEIPEGLIVCHNCAHLVPESGGCMWCGAPILAKMPLGDDSRGGRSSTSHRTKSSPRQNKKTPTVNLFCDFLKQTKVESEKSLSAGGYYTFLTGKKTRLNKNRDPNKKLYKSGFRKWFVEVWTPFFEGQLRPKADELGLGEFSEGKKLKGVMFFKVLENEDNKQEKTST